MDKQQQFQKHMNAINLLLSKTKVHLKKIKKMGEEFIDEAGYQMSVTIKEIEGEI